MDRKGIIVLSVSFILLILWYPLMSRYYGPQNPSQVATNQVDSIFTQTNEYQSPAREIPQINEPDPMDPSVPSLETFTEEKLDFDTDLIRYHFTSRGGVGSIELKEHLESAGCGENGNGGPSQNVVLNSNPVAPVLGLRFGDPLFDPSSDYEMERQGDSVVMSRSLTNGIQIKKVFQPGPGYVMASRIEFTNTTEDSVMIPSFELIIGTASRLLGESGAYSRLEIHWFNGEDPVDIGESWFDNRVLGCLPGTPRSIYQGGEDNVHWGAVNNQFFTIAALPEKDRPVPGIVARKLNRNLPGSTAGEIDSIYQAGFVFPKQFVGPGEKWERSFEIYSGPKEYKTLAKMGEERANKLDTIMNFGFFGLFSKMLLLSMNLLNNMGLAYGLAIVAITVIIKLIFWPLTRASTRSMKRMAALQPEMKAIQEKYKQDPQKMNKKMMEFMREHKVNPLGGCLPMLIQIPVFMGFFFMIQSAIELRGASFLWACDLSQPDTIFILPGLNFPINLLPLLMGATQLWQMKLTPPSPGMDPMQQKIMQYMPLIFVVFLYNFSSGLTLYWTVQNLLSILQTKLTKNEPVQTGIKAGAVAPGKPVGPAKPKTISAKKRGPKK